MPTDIMRVARSRRVSRAAAVVASVATAIAVAACQDVTFVHTNPYDLEANPTIVIDAPDSLFTLGASFTAGLQSDLPMPDALGNGSAATWAAAAPLGSFFNGVFHVTDAVTVAPVDVTLSAQFGSRTVTTTVVVMQRPTVLDLACATFPCDTLRSLGDTDEFPLLGHDADGLQVVDGAGLVAASTITIRDVSVTSRIAATVANRVQVRAEENGTTWLVATYGDIADSVRLVVHQRLDSWTNTCPESIAVGETVELRTRLAVDARGNPMAVPFDGPLWRSYLADATEATVTPSGEVTGVSPGEYVAQSHAPNSGHTPACIITITPP